MISRFTVRNRSSALVPANVGKSVAVGAIGNRVVDGDLRVVLKGAIHIPVQGAQLQQLAAGSRRAPRAVPCRKNSKRDRVNI